METSGRGGGKSFAGKNRTLLSKNGKWARRNMDIRSIIAHCQGHVLYVHALNNCPSGYVNDAQFCIDNNPVERSIRPLTLNRKNTPSPITYEVTCSWAIFFSLMGCCRENKVNPNYGCRTLIRYRRKKEKRKRLHRFTAI